MSRKDRFRQRNKAAIIIQTKVRQQQALALFRLMQRQKHLTAGQVELYLLRAEFMMFVMRRRWHIAKRARDRLWRRKTRLIKRIRATRLLQRTWRGTLGRYRFSVIKARHDAIIRMQTLVRGHIVRVKKIIEKRRKIAAQRRRVEFAASIIINKAARQRLAAKDFLLRRKALLEYHAFLDKIQMTWKRLVRMALIKRNRDVALEEMEKDKLVELQKLMKLQTAAAIEFQRIIRGHREHQRIPMMLAERERIKKARFRATLHIQRRRRREIERRWWRRRYKKMRREMIRRARQAQEVVRPWVKEYPTVTMRKVGDLLDRAAEKVCLWEIKKLLLIRREMEEYKRRDMATLKIQCQWRSYKGQQTLKMLQRIALEKRRALEKKMSTRMQAVMRRYMAIFLVENRRLYLHWLNLLERLGKCTPSS